MTIAQACKTLNLSADTLRYYEKVGLIPKIGRTESGLRDYTSADCNWIEFIKCMRNAGVQVESLVEYVKLYQEGDSTHEARKDILVRERDRISAQVEAMQQTLTRLNFKIEKYETKMKNAEPLLGDCAKCSS
ncbi:MAG: MerR family transcriptional regulator [Clostridiales bacterium]|jgi:DNA-binding transcriptional MerR regulator|nr:MerR family transcriptional regulator [Clostridiales bacterium]